MTISFMETASFGSATAGVAASFSDGGFSFSVSVLLLWASAVLLPLLLQAASVAAIIVRPIIKLFIVVGLK